MKLCLVVRAGKPIEVTAVPDDHKFGEHGDHVHMSVSLTKDHECGGEAEKRSES